MNTKLLPIKTEPKDPATVSEVSRMFITLLSPELPVAFMCVYKPKRPETSKPFLVGAFTVKPQTFGNRPTDIDEISDPPSPPTVVNSYLAPPPNNSRCSSFTTSGVLMNTQLSISPVEVWL